MVHVPPMGKFNPSFLLDEQWVALRFLCLSRLEKGGDSGLPPSVTPRQGDALEVGFPPMTERLSHRCGVTAATSPVAAQPSATVSPVQEPIAIAVAGRKPSSSTG